MSKPEILAPAGDRAALEAAVRAGADAVYFGLRAFSARARATNFDAEELAATMRYLHEYGVRGYVTLNTLVFDSELASMEAAIRACATAGADAIIVQDLGVAKLARRVAPDLPMHASTQMTCTDASAVELAKELGATRVILARELSTAEIAKIRSETDVEVEVFVHGALCIAYSGQCLTSEAIGGRSANRGACAQACRLPYELVVDGTIVDTSQRAYLLSPEDLEASDVVPELVRLGVSSLKIEGRLKGPEYVGATTRLYRKAVDAAVGDGPRPSAEERRAALQTFTRGSGPGFLNGVDHQRLVEGRTCDHRGLPVGALRGAERVKGRAVLAVALDEDLARGDGILVEGGLGGEGELGGRVWGLEVAGQDVPVAPRGTTARVWLGPDVRIGDLPAARRVFKTSDPRGEKRLHAELAADPKRVALDLRIGGRIGAPFWLEGRTPLGGFARIMGDAAIEEARTAPLDEATLRHKLGGLGDGPFTLGTLDVALPAGTIVPVSSLKRARRALVAALIEPRAVSHATTDVTHEHLLASALPPARKAPPAGLFVLCRNLPQARAAIESGAAGVYLDFLELTGTGYALRELRAGGAFVGVAPPRIRKPGEEKIDEYVGSLGPDATLVRGLGALRELAHAQRGDDGALAARPLAIGDFSLNVTNRLAAAEVLARGLDAFTPSFDLDAAQLIELLRSPFGPWAEVVLHHPMALFHMEHCVFAALLSEGRDYKTCGRPCDSRQLSLRDRAGMDHPVEADVGCRNTVFHARPESAVQMIPELVRAGVSRYRIEVVRETPDDVRRLVRAYQGAIGQPASAAQIWKELRTQAGYGVVQGSLRVLPS
jgi:putative protease